MQANIKEKQLLIKENDNFPSKKTKKLKKNPLPRTFNQHLTEGNKITIYFLEEKKKTKTFSKGNSTSPPRHTHAQNDQ